MVINLIIILGYYISGLVIAIKTDKLYLIGTYTMFISLPSLILANTSVYQKYKYLAFIFSLIPIVIFSIKYYLFKKNKSRENFRGVFH